MTKGDRVTVYEDPITQCKTEGVAKLIDFMGDSWWDGKRVELWSVKFTDDPKRVVYRKILTD